MNQHRENLQKLIKMMKGVYDESITDNKSREMLESEAERYISYERLLSIRELTRMFIDELNSEYMQCSEGDEVVGFIEDTIEWLQYAYDFTIEHNAGSTGVKSLKVCSQALNDYKKVYKEAQTSTVIKQEGQGKIVIEKIEFGKRNLKIAYGGTTPENLPNNKPLAVLHITEKVLNSEDTKKFDEIYDYVIKTKELLNFNSIKEAQPTTVNITFTGDDKVNKMTVEKLEEIIDRVVEKGSKKYNCK